MPKSVVLFVHGVGEQSQLSALLRPILSLKTDLSAGLSQTGGAKRTSDLLPDWEISGCELHLSPPYVELRRNPPSDKGPDVIRFYEFNYSNLTSVIREVSSVGLERLLADFHEDIAAATGQLTDDRNEIPAIKSSDIEIAKEALRIGDVILAASAPMLGLFPLFTGYFGIGHVVKAYRRFFADVATCALDYPSGSLLFEHFDSAVESIRKKEKFGEDDQFIIVAHSLGSVIAHNYLVRNWINRPPSNPKPLTKLLTFGSPIGILCWLWLLTDYRGLDPARWRYSGMHSQPNFRTQWREFATFLWERKPIQNTDCLHKVTWVNVVNKLDPIATTFPDQFAFFGAEESALKTALPEGIQHTAIQKDWWHGFPHNTYFNDRSSDAPPTGMEAETFSNVLMEVTGLRPPRSNKYRPIHDGFWQDAINSILWFRATSWVIGASLLASSLLIFYREPESPFLLGPRLLYLVPAVAYCWPRNPVRLLALWHKVLWTTWTTRNEKPSDSHWQIIYWARDSLPGTFLRTVEKSFITDVLRRILFFGVVALLVIVIPVCLSACAQWDVASISALRSLVAEHYFRCLLGVFSMSTSLLAFSVAEFCSAWKAILHLRILGTAPNDAAP